MFKQEVEKELKKEIEKETLNTEANEVNDEAKKEEAKEETKKEETPKIPKFSIRDWLRMKTDSITSSVNEKYPRVYKVGSYMKEVWDETFPNEKWKINSKIEERKAKA